MQHVIGREWRGLKDPLDSPPRNAGSIRLANGGSNKRLFPRGRLERRILPSTQLLPPAVLGTRQLQVLCLLPTGCLLGPITNTYLTFIKYSIDFVFITVALWCIVFPIHSPTPPKLCPSS